MRCRPGIHAQHHGFDLFVGTHAGQRRSQRIAVNLAAEALAVDDRTVGIYDSNLVGRNILEVGTDLRRIFAQGDEIVLAVGIGLHAQLGKDVVHLVFVEQAIHEPVFEGILVATRPPVCR